MKMEEESPATTAQRGIELLNELIALQTRKDGIPRAPIGVFGHMDDYSRRLHVIGFFMQSAALAMPALQQLNDLGRALEERGQVKMDFCHTYADSALHYLTQQVQSPKETAC